MDANKAETLRKIGYEVSGCGLCTHYREGADPLFGECAAHFYDHAKHVDNPRPLSVTRYGRCFGFQINPVMEHRLHGYNEFVPEG